MRLERARQESRAWQRRYANHGCRPIPIRYFGALHRECTELTCPLQKLEHNRLAGTLTDTQSVGNGLKTLD